MANPSAWTVHQFSIVLALLQVVFLILIALFSQHKPGALPGGHPETEAQLKYTDLQDVHVTLIIGFGFLVAFLRRYGFASFGLSLLLIAFTVEWSLIIRGLLSPEFKETGKFSISIYSIIQADFTAAVILISFGALIGKLSPIQYLVLAFVETPISIIAELVILKRLLVQDVGGAVTIHVFGAAFGAVVSRFLHQTKWNKSEDAGSVYHSEVISFVGAAFLWVFWPSFNAANVAEDARYRAIINSYMALFGSTVAAFLVSQFVNKGHFNIRHIVSASLAGGVALGASANILVAPFHAILIGVIAGAVSIIGFQFLNPIIGVKLGFHDTRGVLYIHGLPGIIGSVASAIFLSIYPDELFPASTKIVAEGRSNLSQALFQLAGVAVALLIAILAGAVTGLILKLKIWKAVKETELFCDSDFFDVPEDYDFTTRVTSHIDRVELNENPETTKLTSPILGAPTTVTVEETTN